MIGIDFFRRVTSESGVDVSIDEMLAAWDIDHDAFTQFVVEYTGEALSRNLPEGLLSAAMLIGGFEFGYKAALESQMQGLS